MRKFLLIASLTFALNLSIAPGANAQSSASVEETEKSLLAMESNIVKLCGMMVDFAAVKGNQIIKQADGTLIYDVKDCDMMQANRQLIVVKAGGAAYYIASYTGDNKKLLMSYGAFKLIRSPFKVEKDIAKSTGDEEVHSLLFQGVKVGSYMINEKKGEGRMTIGFL
ncbi:MAG: hypothetical protein JWP81_306 [Ferruginibacter sp.]|nr:hypothetical protein [Ferruginibacter sp.]